MKILFILNEGPYGNERSYNGLRLAISLAKQDTEEVGVKGVMELLTHLRKKHNNNNGLYFWKIMKFLINSQNQHINKANY